MSSPSPPTYVSNASIIKDRRLQSSTCCAVYRTSHIHRSLEDMKADSSYSVLWDTYATGKIMSASSPFFSIMSERLDENATNVKAEYRILEPCLAKVEYKVAVQYKGQQVKLFLMCFSLLEIKF
ncbi:hypothetical protein LXL04_024752 [Taraxacum kok-saghyz]